MKSEQDKMLGGELYDPLDPQLSAERRRARLLFKALNDTRDDQLDERARLIRVLIPAAGRGVWIEPPFYCDYGSNITLGDKVFFNFNCVIRRVGRRRCDHLPRRTHRCAVSDRGGQCRDEGDSGRGIRSGQPLSRRPRGRRIARWPDVSTPVRTTVQF